jgi:hypothetical protein
MSERVVKITQTETFEGRVQDQPNGEGTKPLPTHHQVYVGSDDEGWIQVPYVTNVLLDLKQGELRKAVITVLFPEVEFTGGHTS